MSCTVYSTVNDIKCTLFFFHALFTKDLFQIILFLFISCSCRLGVLGNDGRSCNYTRVLYYLSNNYVDFIDTQNKKNQSIFLPSNGTVSAVTYDVKKRRLFYADVRSQNSKIAVIFSGNGTRREIYVAGKHNKYYLEMKISVNPFMSGFVVI